MTRTRLIPLVLIFSLGCKTSSPAPPTVEPSTTATTDTPLPIAPDKAGDLRVIHTVEWPAGPWGVSLVGITSQDAIILLKDQSDQPKLAIDTISLSSGLRTDRWLADDAFAGPMVNGYPGFRGMSRDAFQSDLTRYASMIRDIGGWSYREAMPPLGVMPSPSTDQVVFGKQPEDGRDGDWLMAFQPDTQRITRLDKGLRASYHPNYSPDGSHIAWIGGSPEFAAPGRQIGYVLRIADTKTLTHSPISAIGELLRTPIWSKDSQTLYAFGKKRRKHCLFALDISTKYPEELLCHDTNMDIMLSPDTSRALLLKHAQRDEAQHLVTLDFETGEEIMQMEVSKVQGLGAFGVWLDDTHFGLISELGDLLTVLDTTTGEELAQIKLSNDLYTIRGRHGMKIVDGELIVLRQHQSSQKLELVGIRLR